MFFIPSADAAFNRTHTEEVVVPPKVFFANTGFVKFHAQLTFWVFNIFSINIFSVLGHFEYIRSLCV